MLAVSAWHLRTEQRGPSCSCARAKLSLGRAARRRSCCSSCVGSHLGVIETKYQPMKIAAPRRSGRPASRARSRRSRSAAASNDETPTKIIAIPHLLSLLATGTWNGQVVGLNELQAQYEQQYGPGDYVPNVFIQYWSMRVMAYLGSLLAAPRAVGRAGCCAASKLERSRVFLRRRDLGRPRRRS